MDLWLEDRGGPGAPVVLVHPGWGDAAIWLGVVERLGPDYRAIRYDNRGYGHSPAPAAEFSWHDDLAGVLDRLSVDRAVIVGHSGGGAAALSLAVTQPDRVAALVLVAPGVSDYPWPKTGYGTEFGRLYRDGDRAGLVELGLRTWAAADPGPAARQQIQGAVDAMFRIGEHMRPDPPAYERLSEITAPVRLLLGDRDDPMVAGCVHATAARLPHAGLTVVPGSDHLLPLHHPELVVAAIESVR